MKINLQELIPVHILEMNPYVPGLQLNKKEIIKLNTNENPFPLPEFIQKKMIDFIYENRFHLYPDPESKKLREKIAEIYKKNSKNILIGNGSDEVLSIAFRTFLTSGDKILILEPSYSLYPILAKSLNVECIKIPLNQNFIVDPEMIIHNSKRYNPKMIVITNPNAPTGIGITKETLLNLYKEIKKPILIDEAYVFFGGESIMNEAGSEEYPLLMSVSTFSKAFSLCGLRIGWMVAHQSIISEMDKIRDSYNVNIFSQFVALSVLENLDYFYKRIDEIIKTREWFINSLNQIHFSTLPSQTNFVFTSPPNKGGEELYNFLLNRNILVRFFKEYKEYVRISIGTQSHMETLYEAIKEWL